MPIDQATLARLRWAYEKWQDGETSSSGLTVLVIAHLPALLDAAERCDVLVHALNGVSEFYLASILRLDRQGKEAPRIALDSAADAWEKYLKEPRPKGTKQWSAAKFLRMRAITIDAARAGKEEHAE